MTYEESAALMTNPTFRGRIKVACLTFASYVLGEPPGSPAHSTRVRWAQQTYAAPDQSALNVQAPLVMDAAVQAAGADITDEALQSAVETTVNRML